MRVQQTTADSLRDGARSSAPVQQIYVLKSRVPHGISGALSHRRLLSAAHWALCAGDWPALFYYHNPYNVLLIITLPFMLWWSSAGPTDGALTLLFENLIEETFLPWHE